jgi:chromosome partitioning protein
MRIIAIANQKGGVGKTTTAINLSACLAEKGVATLLIDLDPQANSTSGLGISAGEGSSLYSCLIGDDLAISKIQPSGRKNLSVIPSYQELAGICSGCKWC